MENLRVDNHVVSGFNSMFSHHLVSSLIKKQIKHISLRPISKQFKIDEKRVQCLVAALEMEETRLT